MVEYFSHHYHFKVLKSSSELMQNDDSDDDEVDKCVYVVRKYVWEYGSYNYDVCM